MSADSADSIIEGVTTGLVGASVLAGLTFAKRQVNSAWRRHCLRSELSALSVGVSQTGLTITIRNATGWSVRIRDVSFRAANSSVGISYGMKFTGRLGTSHPSDKARWNRLYRDWKKGKPPSAQPPAMHSISSGVQLDKDSFLEMGPFTAATYEMPFDYILKDEVPREIVILVESKSDDGRVELLHVHSSSEIKELILSTCAHILADRKQGETE